MVFVTAKWEQHDDNEFLFETKCTIPIAELRAALVRRIITSITHYLREHLGGNLHVARKNQVSVKEHREEVW